MTWAALVAHEVRLEARTREALVPALLVGLLVVLLGALAFHDVEERHRVAGGVLWLGLVFASSLVSTRAFAAEQDRGTLDVLLTLPVARGGVYLAKALAHALVLLVLALVLAPTYLVASGEGLPASWPALALLLPLGIVGLAATGTLLGALVARSRSREMLLPVLLLPLLVPLVVATVHASADVFAAAPFEEYRGELLVLAGYDVAFLAASFLLFESVVGA